MLTKSHVMALLTEWDDEKIDIKTIKKFKPMFYF